MSNPLNGWRKLNLPGKAGTLQFGFTMFDFIQLEDDLGCTTSQALIRFGDGDMRVMQALATVGLKSDHKAHLSDIFAGHIEVSVAELREVLSEAVFASMYGKDWRKKAGEAEEDEGDAKKKT